MCLKSKIRSGKCGSVGKMLAWHAQRPEVQSLVLHSLSMVLHHNPSPGRREAGKSEVVRAI